MTRMTREFSLVLLGSSLLAGSAFFVGDEDPEHKANREVQQQLAGGHGQTTHHSRTHFYPIFFHSSRSMLGSGRAPSSAGRVSTSVSRGGFGSTGHGMSGVS